MVGRIHSIWRGMLTLCTENRAHLVGVLYGISGYVGAGLRNDQRPVSSQQCNPKRHYHQWNMV